jgi:hypothetical protein
LEPETPEFVFVFDEPDVQAVADEPPEVMLLVVAEPVEVHEAPPVVAELSEVHEPPPVAAELVVVLEPPVVADDSV